jgi:predicted secreted protein
MDIITAIIIYLLIWWTLIFAVLPFGNNPDEKVPVGQATSAPSNPRIKKKFLITTLLSFVLWGIIVAVIHYSNFSYYDWVYNWE